MASRRRRRNAQQIPKNIKTMIAAVISIVTVVALVIITLSTISGAALTNFKVGVLFLGLAFNPILFIYNFSQLKATGYDTKVTVLCTLVSFVSMAAYVCVYVIGYIS